MDHNLKTGFSKMAWKTRIKFPKLQNYFQVLLSKCLFWITGKKKKCFITKLKKKKERLKVEKTMLPGRGEQFTHCLQWERASQGPRASTAQTGPGHWPTGSGQGWGGDGGGIHWQSQMRRGDEQGLGCNQEETQDWRQGGMIPDPARVDPGSPGSQWGLLEVRLVAGLIVTQVQGPCRRPGWAQPMYDTAQTRILLGPRTEAAWLGTQVRLVRATKLFWSPQGPDNIFIFPTTSGSVLV